MSFLIFLLVAFISVKAIKPKNKDQLWLCATLIPFLTALLYVIISAGIYSSHTNISASYIAGQQIAEALLCAIIAGVIIYIFLKKKLKGNNE